MLRQGVSPSPREQYGPDPLGRHRKGEVQPGEEVWWGFEGKDVHHVQSVDCEDRGNEGPVLWLACIL